MSHLIQRRAEVPADAHFEEEVQSWVAGGCCDVEQGVALLLPLLFALAARERLADPEEAVFAALQALCLHGAAWPRSGLSPKTWVVGIALQAFERWPREGRGGVG